MVTTLRPSIYETFTEPQAKLLVNWAMVEFGG
jgi:hypothetical protein